MHLGDVVVRQGDYIVARTHYEECLRIQRELGDPWGIAQLLNNLGEAACCEGDHRRAAPLYRQA